MGDFFFILGFLGILIAFSLSNGARLDGSLITIDTPEQTSGYTEVITAPQQTPAEKENRIAELYQDLNTLKDEVRESKLWGTPSPYRDIVTLSQGSVWGTNPKEEYLTLQYAQDSGSDINISDWYVESYVTRERAGIPEGDRVLEKWRSPQYGNIILSPYDEALLITGDSPINVSFRENLCTGYLNDEKDFYPQLKERCTSPIDELKDHGKIRLDDDACYEFVQGLGTCEMPNARRMQDANIGGRCENFIDRTFEYDNCVLNHKSDPFFIRDGYWYIYFERDKELWRPEREIIRLFDGAGRVVDVLEY